MPQNLGEGGSLTKAFWGQEVLKGRGKLKFSAQQSGNHIAEYNNKS
jgi:hypothetical protein